MPLFTVERVRRWDSERQDNVLVEPPQWKVHLPHQCDEWEITWGGEPQETAIASLASFIAEAKVALEHLKAGREDRDEGD